ncbi:MAG: hypothetical protein L0Z70_06990 [Chloroflexi bacterium]|nr:hypothetical protein [Chloroflexota bacterium]
MNPPGKTNPLRNWAVPAALFLLNLVSFGLLVPWLGFYWDDWPSIWFLHFLKPQGFIQVFASDRPTLGWLFSLTTRWLGENPAAWQVFGFFTRWASALAFWQLLRSLWPRHPRQTGWAAALFAVYPGFSQQYIAVTYSHVFIVQALTFLSLSAMLQAVKHGRRGWLLATIAMLSGAYSLFTVEYFFGMELLRPLLLWRAFREPFFDFKLRLRRTLTAWLPYLAVLLLFLIWRLALHPNPRGEVQIASDVLSEPSNGALFLLQTMLSDLFQSGVQAWLLPLDLPRLESFGLLPTLLYIAVVLSAVAAAFFWLAKNAAQDHARRWGFQAAGWGALALFLAGWPFWITDLPIELRFPWDRFTLAMMPGASLLLTGLIEASLKSPRLRAALLSLFIALSIGQHFYTANLYRREWQAQKDFFWQLAWRAPAIQEGTLFLASELPFEHFSDNSLTAPFNWMYAPDRLEKQMPYFLVAIESRLGDSLPSLEEGADFSLPYRAAAFTGSLSQAIVGYYTPPGCLKIFDSRYDARLPQKPKFMSDALDLSRVELILPYSETPASPPAPIFSPEPERGWCYSFEKAELARQQGNWEMVAAIASEAFPPGQRLYEVNAPEYLPYVEAFIRLDNPQQAQDLTRQAYALTPRMARSLCAAWQRAGGETAFSTEMTAAWEALSAEMKCAAVQ